MLLMIATGCGQSSTTPEAVIEPNNQQDIADDLPQRIVSIVPGMTEVLFDLGLSDRIVGVTTNCDYPAAAADKAKVGDWIINMESLLALEPDLVVGMPSTNSLTLAELDQLGINTLAYEAQSVADIYELYRIVGARTGTTEAAEAIIADTKAQIESVNKRIAAVPEADRLRVFLEVGYEPLYTASKGSLQDELLTLAGGINVVQMNQAWVEYSVESVLLDNPDAIVILHPASTEADLVNRSGYDKLTAVQENRITDAIDANILVRPTKRIADGVTQLAEFLYE
jgi:iron complex transport system substrate-binding protein